MLDVLSASSLTALLYKEFLKLIDKAFLDLDDIE
jgi:hypothetical protein